MEKDKFLEIFNNCVLNTLIFKHVKIINKIIGRYVEIDDYNYDCIVYSWSEVIKNPQVMAGYSYLRELKQYYADHSICKYDSDYVNDTFRAAIKSGNMETLKYLVELAKPISVSSLKIQFNRILYDAAAFGNLEMVKHICTEFAKKGLDFYPAFTKSPLSGDIEMLKYLNEKMLVENDYLAQSKIKNESRQRELDKVEEDFVFNNAAFMGRIDMIEWLSINKPQEKSKSFLYCDAIKGGQLHVIQYLLDFNSHDYVGTLFDHAIFCNQFEIAKLLHENDIIASKGTPIDHAALHGNIECLKWLHENTTNDVCVEAMDNAAINNHLEVLKWLQQHRTEGCSNDIMKSVSRKGHIEVAQWLFENQTNVLLSQRSIDEAIYNGHFELAKWLFEKGKVRPSVEATDYAAIFNLPHIIDWLHENGLDSFSTNIMNELSDSGNLQMIKWFHENHPNLPFTEYDFLRAIGNGDFETMKWMRENRTEISTLKKLDLESINKGDAETIKWLSENFNMDWDKVLEEAVKSHNSVVVDAIIKQGLSTVDVFDKDSVFNDESIEELITGMHFPLVRWLYENRSDCQCTLQGFYTAIKSGQMDMINYLLEKHPEFGNEIDLEDSLEFYYQNEDFEMIQFLFDKLHFQLDELKEFQKKINSSKEVSEILKTLLNDHVKKKFNSNRIEIKEIQEEQRKKKLKIEY
ncbi:hypothetical protein PPL_07457 [Heterostelium album PN500]|uniref:Ankyrin repeat protein n=1 Tax=Heterostelium pallidum (strain ATCC 26659 / Pp 5 / PN500) TaxID=670386 RepID=D3BG06_HETP5|nr:hypothetical protein PPL_07457 [Heterostelium album PN500]EFA79598.1 hypothetical protein PPL_07457 [Heterostelium album PN500]|eukprot:XP_020431719.1 hypothetical protein PPL_07457 [Heterostelium album PN500]